MKEAVVEITKAPWKMAQPVPVLPPPPGRGMNGVRLRVL